SSARQQGQVWDKVKEQQDKLGRRLNKSVADPRSPSSLQLTLEDKDLKAKVHAYVAKLEKCLADQKDAVGFVVTINGKLEGAEVQAFLAAGGKGKATETEVNSRIRVTTREGEAGLCVETRDQDHKGAVIHRTFIAR